MTTLTQSQTTALQSASAALGVSPSWLAALIYAESKWNPSATNSVSGARGLIQWLDSTARGMGYAGASDLVAKNPTVEAQLTGPVVRYLKPYAPFPSFESLVGAVFYPLHRYTPSKALPATVSAQNGGIKSVQEYADRIRKSLAATSFALEAGMGFGVLVFAAVAYWIYRQRGLPWTR